MWLWPFARESNAPKTQAEEILYDEEPHDQGPPVRVRPASSTLTQTRWPGLFQPAGHAKPNKGASADPDDGWPTPTVKLDLPAIIPIIGWGQTTLISLQSVKRGTYDGHPATLVVLTARHADYRTRDFAIFRLEVKLKGEKRSKGDPPKAWWIAYAPESIYLPSRQDKSTGEVTQDTDLYEWELQVKIASRAHSRGIPYRLRVAALIAHPSQDYELQITALRGWPRPPRPCFARKPTEPTMFIDSTLASDDSLVTCANKNGAPCSAQCTDFSKDHMTDKVWRDVLFVPRDRERYFVMKERFVSLYPSLGSDGTMLTREELGEAPQGLVIYSVSMGHPIMFCSWFLSS